MEEENTTIPPPDSFNDTEEVTQLTPIPTTIGTIKKRKRPARKQADEQDVFEDPPHTGLYNIWYDRVQDYSTWRDRRDAKLAGKRFKLEVEKDVGETQAKKNAYVCLYFARGKCVHGHNCKYKHSIPTKSDQDRLDLLHDCFGRERHRTDRDDMGGVGSFNRDNHTLYVGGIRMVANVEDVINKYFGKFGEILNLRILHGRSIAFITYRLRVSAEFAKEAMSDQSIIGNEVLNVRWANEDPNPQVQHQKQDKLRAEAWEQMQQTNPNYFKHYELLSQEQYPNTDSQYPYYIPPSEKDPNSATDGPNWDAAGKRDDEESEDSEEEPIPHIPQESSSHNKPENEDNDESAPPLEDSSNPSQPQSENSSDPPNKDPKDIEYEAWQNFYATLNYPGYYDKSGRYHRYDPKYFDPVKYAKQCKQQQQQLKHQRQIELQQQQLQQQLEQPDDVYDYYQYYASYPVGGEIPMDSSDYYNHFQEYGTIEQEGQPPVYYSQTALDETRDAPLYPPQ